MRTDIKIGVAILLFLLVLAALWMLFNSPQQDQLKKNIQIDNGISTPAGTLETEQHSEPMDEDLDIGPIGIPDDMEEIPEPAITSEDDNSLDDFIGGIDEPNTDNIDIPVAPSIVNTQNSYRIEEPEEEGIPMNLDMSSNDQIPAVLGTSNFTGSTVKDRNHTIQEGETLWIIAEKVYGPGNGKYWQKIKGANPNLNASTLRVGQAIRIPALVRESSSSPFGPGLTTSITGINGQKTYSVREGDSLWKIAARIEVYGDGSKWQRISNANPNINTMRLQPGMKLIIPPLEASSSASRTSNTIGSTTLAGQSIYIVQEGDAGMWGIAVKKLGNGKYWPAISKANKGINPSRLKPGMKLIIPSLSQVKQITRGSSSAAPVRMSPVRRPQNTPRVSPASDSEPIFD